MLGLSPDEALIYSALLALVLLTIAINYAKGYQSFWSPVTIGCVIYGYYCLLGPYQAIVSDETTDRLIEMRGFYFSSFLGAFIALASFIIGFSMKRKDIRPRTVPNFPDHYLYYYGIRVFILGFLMFTISTGGNVGKLLNPLDAQYVENIGGTFGNYLALGLNFLVAAVTLLFLYFLRTKKKVVILIITFLVAIGLFTSLGFRYRIVLLLSSMAIVLYYHVQKRPSLVFLVAGMIGLIILMGVINKSRRYGSGLDVKKLEGTSSSEYYDSGLKEAKIFQTSGAIIDLVPSKTPFAGFQPILSTLTFPIPRALYPEKDSFGYLENVLKAIYGPLHGKGAATLAYGEYYLAFGWTGIIVGSFILGWIYKKLWSWYLSNAEVPFVSAVYAVAVVYLYVILSRGYLPQVTNLFFFTVVPAFLALRYAKKKARREINAKVV